MRLLPIRLTAMLVPALLLPALLMSGCARPPPEAFSSGGGPSNGDLIDLGQNTASEPCVQSSTPSGAEVYCGSYSQPSGRVRSAGAATDATLSGLVGGGPWRAALDTTYRCPAPTPGAFGGANGLLMTCTRLSGGWEHLAGVVLSNNQAYLIDGVVAARPALERAVAILSGRSTPQKVTSAALEALQAQRASSRARSTGDVREFDTLMQSGARANLVDNSAAAEAAYGAALALQEKALGKENPNLADPAMHLALQLSNQGRFDEAGALFKRAERLVPQQQGDTTLKPQLAHFEGLHAFNQKRMDEALGLLRRAEDGYVAGLPQGALTPQPRASRNPVEASIDAVLATPQQQQARKAIVGLIEIRRYEGVVLREMGRTAESEAAIRSAFETARVTGLERPELTARINRTRAITATAAGTPDSAISAYSLSNRDFARAYPASRPFALIGMLQATELVRAGRAADAVTICRVSVRTLIDIKSAFEPERMSGCLEAFAAAAEKGGSERQPLLRDMFLASQLVRGSTTSVQIQQASARLVASGSNSAVATAIRNQEDAVARLADLQKRIETAAQAERDGAPVRSDLRQLQEAERKAQQEVDSRESELQAAAPNYGALIQQATPAADVFKALKPGEAFAAVTLTKNDGWTFLLRDNEVSVGRVRGGSGGSDPLVARIRKSMVSTTPTFDIKASQDLYALIFGQVAPALKGVKAITVAPTGGLLSLPFAVLLDGPADPSNLGKAAWLIRQMAIAHVPSAGNFVLLRKTDTKVAQPSRPWFGFGDFRRVTAAQARASFPAACGDSAAVIANLPPLPSATKELETARAKLGGSPGEELVGQAFTASAVRAVDLKEYRVLHFATHALLPTDLKCQTEPALIASAPPGAKDASGALIKASDIEKKELKADLVILSACNSGGTEGSVGSGESLSSLARSFFYGGARSLLITHWEVDDTSALILISDALGRLGGGTGLDMASALRETDLAWLERVSNGVLPAQFGHPFYWAPFAMIGPAGAATAPAVRTAAR